MLRTILLSQMLDQVLFCEAKLRWNPLKLQAQATNFLYNSFSLSLSLSPSLFASVSISVAILLYISLSFLYLSLSIFICLSTSISLFVFLFLYLPLIRPLSLFVSVANSVSGSTLLFYL